MSRRIVSVSPIVSLFGRDPKAGQQVFFNRDDFEKAIEAHGYAVTWERAALCPNRRGGLGPRDHAPACQLCDGRGFVYFGSTTTKMLITGLRLNEGFYAYGRWDSGSATVTSLPEEPINYWDRITLTHARGYFQELVKRQRDTDTDVLKYPPLQVSYVTWVDVRAQPHVATVGVDVAISGDGRGLTWLTQNRPQPGPHGYYSVVYAYRPRYVILELAHQHRDQVVEDDGEIVFPVQAMARLDFLIRDQGKDADQAEGRDPLAVDG